MAMKREIIEYYDNQAQAESAGKEFAKWFGYKWTVTKEAENRFKLYMVNEMPMMG